MSREWNIKQSLLMPRPGELIFDGDRVNLSGYAVIPVEEYHALCNATGFSPENQWPCGHCGAPAPTTEGHDPCIANLPGVIHACCGHGVGRAYAMFSDGRIIRGFFDALTTQGGGDGR